jgi:hypothetical protein
MTGVVVPADAAERLRAHAETIVRHAGIPSADRRDVAEELGGHLVERWSALVADGLEPGAAADRAIADFGTPADLRPAFVATYHSRLWASTIGVLLPIAVPGDGLPSVVRWTARGATILAVLSGILGGVAALTLPPVAAIVTALAMIGGSIVVGLGAEAFRRRQRWGLGVVAIALVAHALVLVTAATTSTGGVNISLNGLLGLVLLLVLWVGSAHAAAWVRGSPALPGRLRLALAVAIGSWGLAPYAAPAIPDPSQAGPDDIHVIASVECGREAGQTDDLSRVLVELVVTWDVVDVLPGGLAGSSGWTDAVDVEFPDPAVQPGGPFLYDARTGQELDASGALLNAVHPAIRDRADGFIPLRVMQPGRPVRLALTAHVWGEAAAGPVDPAWVHIRYAHGPRFILENELACGGSGPLHPESDFARAAYHDLLTGELR